MMACLPYNKRLQTYSNNIPNLFLKKFLIINVQVKRFGS